VNEAQTYIRNLWLAGLGVVAEVEAESRTLFDGLVEKGRPVEERQKRTAQAVTEHTATALRELGQLVQDTVEYESKSLMKRLGLATRDDFSALSSRLETLSSKIDEVAARRKVDAAEAAEAAETDEPVILAADGTPVTVEG
jgi:poly(hydroxyalkanoate) granule-associated protein